MRHVKVVSCPFCGSEDLQKNGHSPNGTQRWKCKTCGKFFQLSFKNKGRLPDVKRTIITMITNGSGIRDTARVLGISPHTVIGEVKKNSKRN